MYKFACKFNDEIIFYFDKYGNKYVASGGNLAWRLNNPGLVRSHSHFARSNGSIGNCDGYAIFSDPQQGRKALLAWVRSKKYYESTLRTIAEHYREDAADVFLNQLTSFAEISPDSKVKLLSEQEFYRLIIGIEKLCGYISVGNEKFSLLPKIVAKIERGQGREDAYLIGDNIVLSKEEAERQVLSHQLDAVIIHDDNNSTYLRSRPKYSFQKIRIHTNGSQPSVSEGEEINSLVRVVGEKKAGQCIWGFINGINNSKEEALASATLISQVAGGEAVFSMPNDTAWFCIKDGMVCFTLKFFRDTPIVKWAAKFFQYLLNLSKEDSSHPPVIIFAHSQGAIIAEHALELLDDAEKEKLIIFTFGGDSFIAPGKSHPDSHNYAGATDFVCNMGSPNLQYLALQVYLGSKNGQNLQEVAYQLGFFDAMLALDTTNPQAIEVYAQNRAEYYEKEFVKIRDVTVLDPDPECRHSFRNRCYQGAMRSIVKKYQCS